MSATLSLGQKLEAVAIGILVIAAVIALVHRDGEKKGSVKQELKENAKQVKELKTEAVVVRAQTIAKRAEYHAARAKIEVDGDSVFADGLRVNLPSVANLIRVADAHSAQDSTDQTKQDLLVATLGRRADLLEQEQEPWCGRKCGIAIGTAATITAAVIVVKVILPLVHR